MGYKITMWAAVAMCLSAVIGDTLFVVTGVPIAQTGSNTIAAYLIVGVLALIIALQFGELGTLMPGEKGVGYSYVRKVFGSEMGFITGVLLFISYCGIISAITFSFGGYLLDLFGISSVILQIFVAIILIIAMSLVTMKGVQETTTLSKIFMTITLIAAIAFFFYALSYGSGHGFSNTMTNSNSQNTIPAFAQAITTIVFAYAGFQSITSFTGRLKGQGSSLIKVLAISMTISIVAYLMIDIALMILVPASQTTSSTQPLLYALHYVNAPSYVIIAFGVVTLIAIAASMLAIISTASRLLYQLGSDGLMPPITKKYDHETGVAGNSIWISAIVAVVILFSGNLYQIVSISNFGIIFSWIMACISVVSMRRRRSMGEFLTPFYPYLQIIGIIACIGFLLGLPRLSLALGTAIILVLIVVFYGLVELRRRDVPMIRLFD